MVWPRSRYELQIYYRAPVTYRADDGGGCGRFAARPFRPASRNGSPRNVTQQEAGRGSIHLAPADPHRPDLPPLPNL